MDILEAIQTRHSVRSYTDQKIEGAVLDELRRTIDSCNADSGLRIQLCLNEPTAFTGMLAHYGRFRNVRNYVALVGKADDDLDEKGGYHGEKIVLKAQQLGLHTCWTAVTFNKSKSRETIAIDSGEKLLMVISIGYGTTGGSPHRVKPLEKLAQLDGTTPDWFRRGVEAAQLAPTAMNQQKFKFKLTGNIVSASPGRGFYTEVDLGIAKYHFEIGAGNDGWEWAPERP